MNSLNKRSKRKKKQIKWRANIFVLHSSKKKSVLIRIFICIYYLSANLFEFQPNYYVAKMRKIKIINTHLNWIIVLHLLPKMEIHLRISDEKVKSFIINIFFVWNLYSYDISHTFDISHPSPSNQILDERISLRQFPDNKRRKKEKENENNLQIR